MTNATGKWSDRLKTNYLECNSMRKRLGQEDESILLRLELNVKKFRYLRLIIQGTWEICDDITSLNV